VLRVQQYCAGHPDAARHAAAALAAIDSIDRAAGWRIQGIDDRLAELGQPAPAEDARTAPFP
jgi:ABC-type nitrate/sulfonate/bicarbonate transport system substrate-binding protein